MSKTILVWDDLKYYPETGLLYRTKPLRGLNLSKPIGTLGVGGYLQCTYKSRQYKVHRLIWRVAYGEWPTGQVDHVNKDKSDNRLINLRAGTSLNQHNRDMPLPSSGIVGAHWDKNKGKFKSSIRVDGEDIFLGYFNCPTSASLTYLRKKAGILNGK